MGSDERLRRWFDEAVGEGASLALYLLALDHLSSVIDFWGRATGEAVWAAFVDRVAGVLPVEEPPVDRGGGRVLAVRRLPSAKDALVFAQRLTSRIADRPFDIPDGRDAVFMTASIGIAFRPAAGSGTLGALEAAALAALEAARRAGGNRASLA